MAELKAMPREHHQPDILHQDRIFRLLVDSVRHYAIFVLDPKGHVATWNPGAERFKGYKANEIIGKHFSVFYPEKEKREGKPNYVLEVAARVGRFEDEGWRIRKDGSRFWANVVITAIKDETGKLVGFGKITRDLTERRQAEQLYRLLVEGVADYAIFSLDPGGFVTTWNTGAQRMKRYTSEEIIGKHFSTFYTPEDRAAGMPDKVLATAVREGHWEGEGWRVRRDGTRFWSSVAITALYDDEGQLAGFSKVTRDMTERKKLLDDIREHARELELRIREREQTNAELEAFSYSVSHDLRAPLRAIEGFATALKEDYDDKFDDTAREYLREISGAAVRMNRLVQDLLSYSRLSRIELALSPTNVSEAIDDAVQELGERRGSLDIQVDRKLEVLAHKPTLVQVIFNLLSNAQKFVVEGAEPQVEVKAGRHDSYLRISVTDHGIGIAPEHQERIFMVFERLHAMDQYPGTGIGLAIVKRGIERMAGRYGLESVPDDGSTFWIELPEVRA